MQQHTFRVLGLFCVFYTQQRKESSKIKRAQPEEIPAVCVAGAYTHVDLGSSSYINKHKRVCLPRDFDFTETPNVAIFFDYMRGNFKELYEEMLALDAPAEVAAPFTTPESRILTLEQAYNMGIDLKQDRFFLDRANFRRFIQRLHAILPMDFKSAQEEAREVDEPSEAGIDDDGHDVEDTLNPEKPIWGTMAKIPVTYIDPKYTHHQLGSSPYMTQEGIVKLPADFDFKTHANFAVLIQKMKEISTTGYRTLLSYALAPEVDEQFNTPAAKVEAAEAAWNLGVQIVEQRFFLHPSDYLEIVERIFNAYPKEFMAAIEEAKELDTDDGGVRV